MSNSVLPKFKQAKDLKAGDVIYSKGDEEIVITGIKPDIYFGPMAKHDVVVVSWSGGSCMCYPETRVIVK